MEDFYRIRRLPPYVFEEVNRAKAASFTPLADVRLPEDQELAAASARVAHLSMPADVVVLGGGFPPLQG